MRLPAPAAFLLLVGAATAATVDEDLVPGGTVRSTVFPASEVETYRVAAPAGSVLRLDLRPLARRGLRPSLEATLSDGSAAALRAPRGNGRWRARLPFPVEGVATIHVGSAGGGSGDYRLRTRLRPRGEGPRGGDEDHRDAADPAALDGSYAAFLAALPGEGVRPPALVTGGVDFDGRGRAKTALRNVAVLPDAGSPFGLALQGVPVGAATGSYWTDGSLATVSLDLGQGQELSSELTVAAGGAVVYSADPAAPGVLLRRTEVPARADLAGSWLYVNAATDGDGATTVEVGSLSLSAPGTASGLGARTTLDAGGAPGASSPVFRAGSFSVGRDGTVTVVTRPNLFGDPEAWTARVVFGEDILAGTDLESVGGTGGLRLLLRQGTGLTDAAVAGDYLHFGIAFGGAPSLRTGVLAFDGEGGFAGAETVIGMDGGAGTPVSAAGAYSVSTFGTATFAYDGGPGGTGIVGPEGRYLFTVALGAEGVGIDLLLSLE